MQYKKHIKNFGSPCINARRGTCFLFFCPRVLLFMWTKNTYVYNQECARFNRGPVHIRNLEMAWLSLVIKPLAQKYTNHPVGFAKTNKMYIGQL